MDSEKGSKDTMEFVIKRSYDDSVTFDSFENVYVDGKKVANDQYTAEQGSLILNVKPRYLQSLKSGEHTLKVVFKDGTCEAGFTIEKNSSSNTNVNPKEYYSLPVTGVE